MRRGTKWLAVTAIAGAMSVFGMAGAHAQDIEDAPLTCGANVGVDVVLTADLGPCAGSGLFVTHQGVTIDLNGHTIEGQGTPGTVGIFNPDYSGLVIKNGTISNFPTGISITNSTTNTVQGMVLTGDTVGIKLDHADGATLKSNHVVSNGRGIYVLASTGGLIKKNTVKHNGVEGVTLDTLSTGWTISKNVANQNGFIDNFDDDNGLGINAPKGTAGSGNTAKGNDDPKQATPKSLLS